jgi:hypothetical protein
MNTLFRIAGAVLLCGALVATGMYAWHGQWAVVLVTLGSAFIGKLVLGILDLVLLPLSLPSLYLARHGHMAASAAVALLFSLVQRAAFACFCAAVLLAYLRVPGPPAWLAVVLAAFVAGSPFAWASQRNHDDAHPVHFDALAATLGVLASGGLLLAGVRPLFALGALAVAFLVPALGHVFWWSSRGALRARRDYYIEKMTP